MRLKYSNTSDKDLFIEFLRAAAVVAVILYHFYPNIFVHGYLGVDVFFVVSGFIITKSIGTKRKSWNSLFVFYKRRILRLLPALYVVLFFTIILSFLLDTPHATKNIGQAILATTVYLANIFYYTEIDYFNEFQAVSPLVHTWSLSLEEQFYLFFPILFFILDNKKLRLIGFSIAMLISLYLYTNTDDNLLRHYMTHLRVWQLLIGVIFALINKEVKSAYLHPILVLLSTGILFSYVKLPHASIIVTLTVVLSMVLRAKKFEKIYIYFSGVGALSYSLYLWHQPILYFGKMFNANNFFLVILVLVFSFLSYKFIESPLRYSKKRKSLIAVCFATFLLLLLGYNAHSSRGWFDLKKDLYGISDVKVEFDYETLLTERNLARDSVLGITTQDSSILIIGDSKAEDLTISLYFNSEIKYNLFVMHANDYNVESFFNNTALKESINAADKIVMTNTWRRGKIDDVAEVVERMSELEHKQVIVLSTSNFEDVSSQYFAYIRSKGKINGKKSQFTSILRSDWQRQSNELKKEISHLHNVVWIDKENAFLNRRDGFIQNNELIIYDTGHLSFEGFKVFGEWITTRLGLNV